MRRGALLLAVLAVLAGCGGDDGADSATSQPERTTTTLSPDEAFQVDYERLFQPDTEAERAAGLDTAHAVCDGLSTVPEDPNGNTSALLPQIQQLYLAVVIGPDGAGPEAGARVLRLTGRYICPEHKGLIEDYLRAQGL